MRLTCQGSSFCASFLQIVSTRCERSVLPSLLAMAVAHLQTCTRLLEHTKDLEQHLGKEGNNTWKTIELLGEYSGCGRRRRPPAPVAS